MMQLRHKKTPETQSKMSVVRANRIILRPHITERTFELIESQGKICFIVSNDATKPQIREAVFVLYNQTATDVNTARTIYGKKAFVKLDDPSMAQDLATKIGML